MMADSRIATYCERYMSGKLVSVKISWCSYRPKHNAKKGRFGIRKATKQHHIRVVNF